MSKKKAIHQAIREVLNAEKSALSPEEIYQKIQERNLYDFHAQDPIHVVQSQLRRHCKDYNFPSARQMRYFTLDGKNKYRLLPEPVRIKPNAFRVKHPGKHGKQSIVTVPQDDEISCVADTSQQTHTEIQWRLLDLGEKLGLKVWAPIADRNRVWNGKRIGDIKGLVDVLPRQFDKGTMRTIEYIDAIWLEKQAIAAAFEVEHTTPVYSGLLRMSDLMTIQPNLDIKWFLVAPEERFTKYATQIARPTFCALRKPLYEVCRFISYDKLTRKLEAAAELIAHLKPTFLDDISEKYSPEEAFKD